MTSVDDVPIPQGVTTTFDAIVQAYKDQGFQELLENFLAQVERPVRTSSALGEYVHSVRTRLKDPEHLWKKLARKYREAVKEGEIFDINVDNFPVRINDLAGLRILHLYTRQFHHIDKLLRELFREYKFKLVEKPFARTWDDEYRRYFREVGLKIEKSESMYTSVHYVLSSGSKTTLTCEVQVRTLMEEVWGEVDHQINYPESHPSGAIREQLRTLARATSAATRLVDCIFACEEELRGSGDAAQQKLVPDESRGSAAGSRR